MIFYPEELKGFRESRGLTQEALGKMVSRARQSIEQYENGKNKPTPETVYALAKALDCSVCELSDLKPKKDDILFKQNISGLHDNQDYFTLVALERWEKLTEENKAKILESMISLIAKQK